MKLNKQQQQVLAKKIYEQIVETYKPQREKVFESIKPKIDAIVKELEEFDWDCKYSKTGITVDRLVVTFPYVINGETITYKNWHHKDTIYNAKEAITATIIHSINSKIRPGVTTSQIEDDLVLASIEAEDLSQITNALVSKYQYV